MFLENRKALVRWVLILTSFIIVSAILWNTYIFFQEFKKDERTKMKIWVRALKSINAGEDLLLAGDIIATENSNPRIIKDDKGGFSTLNIDEKKENDSLYIQQKIIQFSTENEPIDITYFDQELKRNIKKGTLYYGHSEMLNRL